MGITKQLLEDLADALGKMEDVLGEKVSLSESVVEPREGSVNIIGHAVYSVGIDHGFGWSSIDGLSKLALDMVPFAVRMWIAGRVSK